MMTFERLHEQLLETVRQRVRNGQLTERSLARLTGISQPHIHNVLKGVRILNNSLADEMLLQLKINVWDLTENSQTEISAVRNIPLVAGLLGEESGTFEPWRTVGSVAVPAPLAASLWRPVIARLGRDDETRPRFEARDLVLIDQAVRPRAELCMDSIYVMETRLGPRLRYPRVAGEQLFLASESSRNEPRRWELVESGEEVDAVRGRVIWVSRKLASTDGV
jgi:hypothetical protein